MHQAIEISIISPVYQAENIVDQLVSRIAEETEKITPDFEIILIDDGSADQSWEKVKENCTNSRKVKGIRLSRNFGQHYAITAGLEKAQGNYVVIIDCDLQDNPKYISTMYKKVKNGVDIVFTKKKKRKHSFIKNLTASFFSLIFNKLSKGLSYKDSVGSYSMLSRKVVDAFLQVKDYHRHYLMVLGWLGFNSTYIEVDHNERYAGKSSYSFKKLIEHAINGIVSQSTKVLNFSVLLGVFLFIISLLAALFLVINYFISGYKEGWASVMVLTTLSTGMIMMFIGILGLYVGKIFEQVKQRPLYIIDEKVNF